VAIGDTWQNPAIRRCGSKRVFPTLAAAESRARRASLRAKRLLLAYLCPDCVFFHLGHAELVAELIPQQASIPHPVKLCAYCNLRHVSDSKVQEEKADLARYCSRSANAWLLCYNAALPDSKTHIEVLMPELLRLTELLIRAPGTSFILARLQTSNTASAFTCEGPRKGENDRREQLRTSTTGRTMP